MFRQRQERELAALGNALRRQMVGARAVLLVADALDLTARDLLGYTAGHFRAALREISVGKLGDVAKAISIAEPLGPKKADPKRGMSLDTVARFVLDRDDPGSKLDLVERAIIACAMSACSGNQSAASRLLGIERKALGRRLAKGPPDGPREGGSHRKRVRRRPPQR
jgi:DNA-binding NtrC family response regulator